MSFQVKLHEADRIIEIVYPAVPAERDVADYERTARRLIAEYRGEGWACLVDQRQLKVMPPELVKRIAALDHEAGLAGYRAFARVVASAVAGLQAKRLKREAGLETPLETFATRDEALAWLRNQPARR